MWKLCPRPNLAWNRSSGILPFPLPLKRSAGCERCVTIACCVRWGGREVAACDSPPRFPVACCCPCLAGLACCCCGLCSCGALPACCSCLGALACCCFSGFACCCCCGALA